MEKLLYPFVKDQIIFYRIQANETLNDVALKFNVSPLNIVLSNGLTSSPSVGRVLFIEKNQNMLYSVKVGDTLEKIALKFCVDVQTLKKINNIDFVYPFLLIEIPQSDNV